MDSAATLMKYLKLIVLRARNYPARYTILLVRDFLITFDSKFYRGQINSIFGFLFPRSHFLIFGQERLLSPNSFFDSYDYLKYSPTSTARKSLPFLHYLKTASGNRPTTIWDYTYLKFAPESQNYRRNLLVHLKMHGSTQAFIEYLSQKMLNRNFVVPTNLKTKIIDTSFSEINYDPQNQDVLKIEITNCCKSVVMGFDHWVTEKNIKASVDRYFHKDDHNFEGEKPRFEIRGSNDLFIEAHQPIILDVPSISQILFSQIDIYSKLNSLTKLFDVQTPKCKYFNASDSLNFASFLFLKEDLNQMLLELLSSEKIIVRVQRSQLKPIQNILMFSHEDSRTGAPIYALQVVLSLLQNGYNVQVVSLRDNFQSGNFDILGIRHSYLSDHVNLGPSGSKTINDWLLTESGDQAMQILLTKFSPDLIIANSLCSCEAIRIASAARIPSILYVHEAWDLCEIDESIQYQFRLRVRESLEAAQLVLFGSNATLQHWKQTELAINGRVASSYRSITPYDESEKKSTKARFKRHLGLSNSDIVFLSVATFEPRKRIEDIVSAFKSIQDPRINLILLGSIEGPTQSTIRKLVDRDSRIRLIPPTNNLDPYYAIADCLIFASVEETMPLVLQEAALWEIPRIVSKYSGYQELIPSSEFALLFDPKDIDGLALQMLKFLNNDCDAQFLVKNALSQQRSFMENGISELSSGIKSLTENWISVVPEWWFSEKN